MKSAHVVDGNADRFDFTNQEVLAVLNMQAFHKWLTSTGETPNTLQGRMARLARISRARIREVSGDLIWFIWEANHTAA